jgi:tetratricopeptide (TPR) repeat protein
MDFELRQWLAVGAGMALKQQGKFAEAEALYLEAVTNSARLHPTNSSQWEWQFDDLMRLLARLGKVEQVAGLYDQITQLATIPKSREEVVLVAQLEACGYEGHYKEVVECCRKVLLLDPTNFVSNLQMAAALAFLGDAQGYNELCRDCVERFATNKAPYPCSLLAKTCIILPNLTACSVTVSNWARIAANQPDLRPWSEPAMAQVEYRLGNFDEAKKLGEKLASSGGPWPEIETASLCVLAMAQYRLEHFQQAELTLARAVEMLPTNCFESWADCLISQLLLREAKGLIQNGTREY